MEVENFDFESVVSLIHDYDLYVDETDDPLHAIKKYVEENKLNTVARIRGRVHERAYLYNYMRSKYKKMSYESIGNVFNRNHASVLNGIATHKSLVDTKDSVYSETLEKMSKIFRYEE